jgi:hypothetical protein
VARDLFHQVVKDALTKQEPNRVLYLAVPSQPYDEFFRLRFIQEGVEEYQIYLLTYNMVLP